MANVVKRYQTAGGNRSGEKAISFQKTWQHCGVVYRQFFCKTIANQECVASVILGYESDIKCECGKKWRCKVVRCETLVEETNSFQIFKKTGNGANIEDFYRSYLSTHF